MMTFCNLSFSSKSLWDLLEHIASKRELARNLLRIIEILNSSSSLSPEKRRRDEQRVWFLTERQKLDCRSHNLCIWIAQVVSTNITRTLTSLILVLVLGRLVHRSWEACEAARVTVSDLRGLGVSPGHRLSKRWSWKTAHFRRNQTEASPKWRGWRSQQSLAKAAEVRRPWPVPAAPRPSSQSGGRWRRSGPPSTRTCWGSCSRRAPPAARTSDWSSHIPPAPCGRGWSDGADSKVIELSWVLRKIRHYPSLQVSSLFQSQMISFL